MKTRYFISFVLFSSLVTSGSINAQWVQMSNGMGNRTVYSLAYSGNNIFAGTDFSGGVYLSSNNGTSWTQTALNNQNIFSLALNLNYIFAGTQQYGVYRSTNNGVSWTQSGLNNQWITELAVNGSYVFAGVYPTALYLSSNNGSTWIQTPLNNRDIYSLAVNGNNVFAGTYLYGIYISTNNGTAWTQTSLNNRTVYSLAVDGNNIFAGTEYGVYLSTNNGTTWTQTALNDRSIVSLAVNGNNVFAGTSYYGVYVSNNNGASWIQRNEGLSNFCEIALCILNNYIFAGTGCEMPLGVFRRPLSELTGIHLISEQIPANYVLYQNYPNPFNPNTIIRFKIKDSRFTTLRVFDILGHEAATLVNEELKQGTYEVDWDGSNYSSGVYYYKLKAGDFIESRKMVLVK